MINDFPQRKRENTTVETDIAFRERVVATFRSMKFEFPKRPEELTIPIYRQGIMIAHLRPLHAEFIPQEVRFLMEWRNQNREAFLTWVTSTKESTMRWILEELLPREDRILFFAETLDGVPFGHIGLTKFDFARRSCEIDNVLRGKTGTIQGGMTLAIQALMDWGFCFLKAHSMYLRVFADNERAINFYMQNELQMVKRVPLQRVQEGNIIRWVETEEQPGEVPEKYLLYMRPNREGYPGMSHSARQ